MSEGMVGQGRGIILRGKQPLRLVRARRKHERDDSKTHCKSERHCNSHSHPGPFLRIRGNVACKFARGRIRHSRAKHNPRKGLMSPRISAFALERG